MLFYLTLTFALCLLLLSSFTEEYQLLLLRLALFDAVTRAGLQYYVLNWGGDAQLFNHSPRALYSCIASSELAEAARPVLLCYAHSAAIFVTALSLFFEALQRAAGIHSHDHHAEEHGRLEAPPGHWASVALLAFVFINYALSVGEGRHLGCTRGPAFLIFSRHKAALGGALALFLSPYNIVAFLVAGSSLLCLAAGIVQSGTSGPFMRLLSSADPLLTLVLSLALMAYFFSSLATLGRRLAMGHARKKKIVKAIDRAIPTILALGGVSAVDNCQVLELQRMPSKKTTSDMSDVHYWALLRVTLAADANESALRQGIEAAVNTSGGPAVHKLLIEFCYEGQIEH